MPKFLVNSFRKGMGFGKFDADGYGVGIGVDTRSGVAAPGLEPTLNDGGVLAASYYDVKRIVHNVTNWLAMTNGTASKIYRIESGVWVEKKSYASRTGTGTITQSGTTVTGTSTLFTTQVKVGDTITATAGSPLISGVVVTIVSATELTLTTSATQAAGQAYTITPGGGLVITDLISFTNATDDYIIAYYGDDEPWEYSVDDGSNWVVNDQTVTTTGKGAAYGKYAWVQRANLTAPKIAYVTDPNILHFTATPATGATDSVTSTTIDDANANSSYFNSLTENDDGVLLIGKRYELFSVDVAGAVKSVGGPYPDTVNDAGTNLDAKNFANPVHLNGSQYYIVQGYDIFEYNHGSTTLIAPYLRDKKPIPYPHVRRPITALVAFDGELWVSLSSSLTTYFSDTFLLNPINGPVGAKAQLYAGHKDESVVGGWVWHGSLWQASVDYYVRYMWYDPAFRLLYFGTTDATNAQYVAFVRPHGAVDQLSNATGSPVQDFGSAWSLFLGEIAAEDSKSALTAKHLSMVTTGLGTLSATSPSITATIYHYKGNNGSSYSTRAFDDDGEASYGVYLPRSISGSRLILGFAGSASATTKPAILHSLSIDVEDFAGARMPAGIL